MCETDILMMYKLFYGFGIGGEIKESSLDFVVEEILKDSGICSADKKSNFEIDLEKKEFVHATLVKENWNTNTACMKIAYTLGIDKRDVGYSGNKDKNALTSQRISIKGVKIEDLKKINIDGIFLKDISYSNEKIYLGNHFGNRFIISIKNCGDGERIAEFLEIASKKGIANYFGGQRFGKKNLEVAREIIKNQNYERAVMLLLDNTAVKEQIEKNKKDFVSAVKKINRRNLNLILCSYQSYLFNKYLEKKLEIEWKQEELDVVGYDTQVKDKTLALVLKEEGIDENSFIIRKMPEMSLIGGKRMALFFPFDFKIIDKTKFSFSLVKSCYATVLLDELMKKK